MSFMKRSRSGAGLSQLTPEQIERLKETTPYDEKDLAKLLKRYAKFDSSEGGVEGIHIEDVLTFPEFSCNPFISKVLQLYVEDEDRRLYPEKFLYFCAILSPRTGIDAKRQMAFRCLDEHNSGVLQYDEVFKLYRALFAHAIDDQQILGIVYRSLQDLQLEKAGVISQAEFNQMVPDHEIQQCFTVDLQLP